MSDQTKYPYQHPMGSFTNDELNYEENANPSVNNIPWIDIHQHTHTLSWNDREIFDLTGCQATISMAYSYPWVPYRPIKAENVRFLWDDCIKRSHLISRSHFFDMYVSIGIHTRARIDNVSELLNVMPEYCELDKVVAIGETGIDPTQDSARWELDQQKDVVKEQMRIAKQVNLPVNIHTPAAELSTSSIDKKPKVSSDHDTTGTPFNKEDNKLESTKIDIELKDEVGLSDNQVVVDHADETIVEYVMENTDCYLSFSIGFEWLRNINAQTVAKAIEMYGSDRIMIDSDAGGVLYVDEYAMKRTIHDLVRLGVSEEDIRNIVYNNPMEVFDISF